MLNEKKNNFKICSIYFINHLKHSSVVILQQRRLRKIAPFMYSIVFFAYLNKTQSMMNLFVWCLTTHQPLWVISVRRYETKHDVGGKSKNL